MAQIPAPELIEELRQQSLIGDTAGLVLADKLMKSGDQRGEFLCIDYLLERHDLSPEQRAQYTDQRKELYPQFFHIESLPDRFRLRNVFYNHWFYTIDQSKELLDGGSIRTQDQWNEWLKSEQNKEKWHLASGLVYHASLAALHYNQDHPDKKQKKLIKQSREMHAKDFQDNRMMTSTRIIYIQQGEDKIIHDYSSPQQQKISLHFAGPLLKINKESGLENDIIALFGTADLEEMEKVYENLLGRKPELWKINKKLSKEIQLPLVLDAVRSLYFNVSADRSLYDNGSGRGWSVSP